MDTNAVVEEAFIALGIGPVEENAITLKVCSRLPTVIVDIGRTAPEVAILGIVEREDLVIVGVDAIPHQLNVKGISIHVNGGQGKGQIAVTTLITTIIPTHIGGVGGTTAEALTAKARPKTKKNIFFIIQ